MAVFAVLDITCVAVTAVQEPRRPQISRAGPLPTPIVGDVVIYNSDLPKDVRQALRRPRHALHDNTAILPVIREMDDDGQRKTAHRKGAVKGHA
jgi:hypothetical protein